MDAIIFRKVIFKIAVIICICFMASSVEVHASYQGDEELMQQIRDALRKQEEETRVKWGYSGENCKWDAGKLIVQVESKEELFQDIGYRIKDHEEGVYYDTNESVWNDTVMDDYSDYYNKDDLLVSGKYQSFFLNQIEISVEKGYFPAGNTVRVYMQFDYKYPKEEIDAYYAHMRTVANELKRDSDFESVKAAYDYIINKVDYDYTYTNYLDYEGFRDGVMVCNGYSMALFHLLTDMNIPVRMVSGYAVDNDKVEGHAWNVIKVDGAWYNADATWDDPGQEKDILYKYFLKNDEDFTNHFRSDKYKGYGKDISSTSYSLEETIGSETAASKDLSEHTAHSIDSAEIAYYTMIFVFGGLFILMVIVVLPAVLKREE